MGVVSRGNGCRQVMMAEYRGAEGAVDDSVDPTEVRLRHSGSNTLTPQEGRSCSGEIGRRGAGKVI